MSFLNINLTQIWNKVSYKTHGYTDDTDKATDTFLTPWELYSGHISVAQFSKWAAPNTNQGTLISGLGLPSGQDQQLPTLKQYLGSISCVFSYDGTISHSAMGTQRWKFGICSSTLWRTRGWLQPHAGRAMLYISARQWNIRDGRLAAPLQGCLHGKPHHYNDSTIGQLLLLLTTLVHISTLKLAFSSLA